MKKLLLSILTLTTFATFAQKDASIRLLLPAEDQEIVSGKAFQIAFRVTNVGMDTIQLTDTFAITPLILTNAGIQPLAGFSARVKIAPGDSVSLAANNGYVLTFDSDIDEAAFCVSLDFRDSTADTSMDNNVDCSPVMLKIIGTGVSEIASIANSVKAFPIPANSYFTITMKSTDATVDVLDITGKLIESVAVTMGEAKLDVSNYNNGVYFYQIKNANSTLVKSGKFTVSH